MRPALGQMRQLRLVGQLVDVVQEREQLGAFGLAGAVERLGRRVQKLVGKPSRERFEHLLRWRTAGEQAAGAPRATRHIAPDIEAPLFCVGQVIEVMQQR